MERLIVAVLFGSFVASAVLGCLVAALTEIANREREDANRRTFNRM
jgi:hypothetical protein